MRKILGFIIAVTVVFALAACNAGRNDQPNIPPPSDATGNADGVGELPNAASGFSDTQVGDVIQFGGRDWRVLDVQSDRILIITEHLIENRPYHSDNRNGTIWANGDLRLYLNGEFYHSFSADDRARIVAVTNQNLDNQWAGTSGGGSTFDNIFLLSIDEVVRYFGDSGQFQTGISNEEYWISDEYNANRMAFHADSVGGNLGDVWWLRSPGQSITRATIVTSDGVIDGYGISYTDVYRYGVRPALWLSLSEIAPSGNGDGIQLVGFEIFRAIGFTNGQQEIIATTIQDFFGENYPDISHLSYRENSITYDVQNEDYTYFELLSDAGDTFRIRIDIEGSIFRATLSIYDESGRLLNGDNSNSKAGSHGITSSHNQYFSTFAYMEDFDIANYNTNEIISYVIWDLYRNDWRAFVNYDRDYSRVLSFRVGELLQRYFGLENVNYDTYSWGGSYYQDGYFYLMGAEGAIPRWAQVTEFSDNGDSTYTVLFDVYESYEPPENKYDDIDSWQTGLTVIRRGEAAGSYNGWNAVIYSHSCAAIVNPVHSADGTEVTYQIISLTNLR